MAARKGAPSIAQMVGELSAQNVNIMQALLSISQQLEQLRGDLRVRDQQLSEQRETNRVAQRSEASEAHDERLRIEQAIAQVVKLVEETSIRTDSYLSGSWSSYNGLRASVHQAIEHVAQLHRDQIGNGMVVLPIVRLLQTTCPLVRDGPGANTLPPCQLPQALELPAALDEQPHAEPPATSHDISLQEVDKPNAPEDIGSA